MGLQDPRWQCGDYSAGGLDVGAVVNGVPQVEHCGHPGPSEDTCAVPDRSGALRCELSVNACSELTLGVGADCTLRAPAALIRARRGEHTCIPSCPGG